MPTQQAIWLGPLQRKVASLFYISAVCLFFVNQANAGVMEQNTTTFSSLSSIHLAAAKAEPKAPNKAPDNKPNKAPEPPPQAKASDKGEAAKNERKPKRAKREPLHTPFPHHQRFSLNHVSPSQLIAYEGLAVSTALRYPQKTYYSFSGNSAFKDHRLGPQLQCEVTRQEPDRPLVVGLGVALARDHGSRQRPGSQGPVRQYGEASSLSVTYMYRGASFALHYANYTRRIERGYYKNRYFFAWQEFQLAGLYLQRRWEAGALYSPGLLKVGAYQDDDEAYSLSKPSLLRVHGAYRLAAPLAVFAKADILRQSTLNHQADNAWANQLLVTAGVSYRARTATIELAIGMATDGFRGISPESAQRIGLYQLQANVIKALSSETSVGGQLEIGSGDSSETSRGQNWVLTANQRTLMLFATWQTGQFR